MGRKPRKTTARVCRVLLVDDDPDIRSVFVDVFSAEGYCVQAVEDAFAALHALRRRARPDVVILDLLLPRMDGWTFLSLLRADPKLKGTRVLVLSAVAHARRSELESADAVAAKPADLATLCAILRDLCHPHAAKVAAYG